jgi:hypothetical protein
VIVLIRAIDGGKGGFANLPHGTQRLSGGRYDFVSMRLIKKDSYFTDYFLLYAVTCQLWYADISDILLRPTSTWLIRPNYYKPIQNFEHLLTYQGLHRFFDRRV